MKRIYAGKVQGGRIQLKDVLLFNEAVARLEGCEVQITLTKRYHDRSSNQNRYYWGVVIKILSDHFGYLDDEMHEAMKLMFLRKTKGPLETLISTTRLNTLEFEEYVEKIRIWAMTEQEIKIPLPGEVDLDQ